MTTHKKTTKAAIRITSGNAFALIKGDQPKHTRQESPPRSRLRLAGVLSESAARSEFHLAKYCAYWFHDPALPLAISSAVRFSFAGPR
jgi:hypothetical protein